MPADCLRWHVPCWRRRGVTTVNVKAALGFVYPRCCLCHNSLPHRCPPRHAPFGTTAAPLKACEDAAAEMPMNQRGLQQPVSCSSSSVHSGRVHDSLLRRTAAKAHCRPEPWIRRVHSSQPPGPGRQRRCSRGHWIRMAATAPRLPLELTSNPSVGTLDDYRIITNIDAAAVPDNLKKDCVLFYHPDTEPLARRIAAAQGTRVELGNIRWKWVCLLKAPLAATAAQRVCAHSRLFTLQELCRWVPGPVRP